MCGKGRQKRPFQVEEVVKTRCGGSGEDARVCQDKEKKKENKFPELMPLHILISLSFFHLLLFPLPIHSPNAFVSTYSVPGTAVCLMDKIITQHTSLFSRN